MSERHFRLVVAGGEGDGDEPDRLRAQAYAGFIARRDGAELLGSDDSACAALLDRLSAAGLAFRERSEDGSARVIHVARPQTAERFANGASEPWPSALVKKLGKTVRRTPGALFRFPQEEGGDAIHVFITDWSPCPAACALAVHAEHPAAAGVEDGFTGRFVRHPLTGDLLPVLVADWVKPAFGTGAVLVNPAHDRVDLAYARRIGLPIRFALAPEGFDGEPDGWIAPPLIKAGRSVRTGFYDGLDIHEATSTYFDVLAARGLAERHEDVRLPAAEIARIEPDGSLMPSEALRVAAALAAAGDASRPTLVLSAAAARSSAAALAPLLADLDLAPRVIALGAVERTATLEDEAGARAIAIAARPDQPAVVRKDQLDQVRRFAELHERLGGADGAAAVEGLPSGPLRQSIAAGDPAGAFKALYALQKDLAAAETPDPSALAAYRTGCRVLLGG
ncbi:class I tRNA ligase family protein [Salinarimonas ramus]|nr:class I tRNA ligase family protein [Salinarimonas ramus]